MSEVIKADEFKDIRIKLEDPNFMAKFVTTGADSKKWKDILMQEFNLTESDAYSLARDIRDTVAGMKDGEKAMNAAFKEKGVTDPTQMEAQIK